MLVFNYRSQSRSGTLSSSRRSSGSRRGEERWREGEHLEEKLERMMNYGNIKPRLSPLIEVIEPTPPLCRNAPIFGLTGENNLFSYEVKFVELNFVKTCQHSSFAKITRKKLK